MNMNNDNSVFGRSLIAVAVALAFPSGSALADEVQDLTSPNKSEVSLRIQDVNKVNPLYRMYSGVDRSGVTGSVGVDVVKRGEAGDWLKLQGSDLGVSGIQQFGASYEKQGDWRVGLDYNEITKYAPYTINTKVGGVGTGNLTLNQDFRSSAGLGGESSLKLERTATSLTGSKLFSDAFKFGFSFKTEDKKGEIMSSMIGSTLNGQTPGKNYSTMYFAPQPENFRHNQFEATLDYFTKTLQLSGGYYGSFFNNANTGLNITPGNNSIPTLPCNVATCVTALPLGAQGIPWIALPPDNRAQQLFLSGGFNFTDKTRLSFKLSRERLTQDDGFIPAYGAITPLAGAPISATYTANNPPGVPYAAGMTSSSLGGLVDTTAYFGMLTSKLSKDLDLLEVKRIAEHVVCYRKFDSAEGCDGLDAVRHNLRLLRNVNLPDTRLILCSMEGENNYPDIDELLADPQFEDVLDRVVVTAEPNYLAQFTTCNQVISYQRRFLNAANGQK